MDKDEFEGVKIFLIVFVVLMFVSYLIFYGVHKNDHYKTVSIVDKNIVIDVGGVGDIEKRYFITAKVENGEIATFEVINDIFINTNDASETYEEIKIGKSYDITLTGYRIPLFNTYENIICVKSV